MFKSGFYPDPGSRAAASVTTANSITYSDVQEVKNFYHCFISYRHSDNTQPGRQWATWLHQALETYEIPPDLIGTLNERGEPVPQSIFPVFRDEEELPADAALGRKIAQALENSVFLVVLCSPQAVQSRFVADEILHYKRLGRQERILAVIIDGEPNATDVPLKGGAERECFPKPLRFVLGADGALTQEHAEPIAPDFRLPDGSQGWTTPAAYRQALESQHVPERQIREHLEAYAQHQNLMLLKIISGILAIPLRVLTEREKSYQLAKQAREARKLRRWLLAVSLVGIMAIVAGLLAYQYGLAADAQKRIAEKQERIAKEQAKRAEQEARRAENESAHARLNAKRADDERDEANKQRGLVTLERDKQNDLLWKASRGDHETARQLAASKHPLESMAYLERALTSQPKNIVALTAAAMAAVGCERPAWSTRFDWLFEGKVTAIDYHASKDWMVIGTEKGHLAVADLLSGQVLYQHRLPFAVIGLKFQDHGDLLHLALSTPSPDGNESAIWVFDPRTGDTIHEKKIDGRITAWGMNSAGTLEAFGISKKKPASDETEKHGSEENFLQLIDPATHQPRGRFDRRVAVNQLIFAGGSTVVAGEGIYARYGHPAYFAVDAKAQKVLWEDGGTGACLSLGGDGETIALSPGREELKFDGTRQEPDIYEVQWRNGVTQDTFGTGKVRDAPIALSFSPGMEALAVVTSSLSVSTLYILHTLTGKVMFERSMPFEGTVIRYDHKARWLAYGTKEGRVSLLEPSLMPALFWLSKATEQTAEELTEWPQEQVSKNQKWQFKAEEGDRDIVRITRKADGKEHFHVEGDVAPTACAFTPDSKYLVVGDGFPFDAAPIPLRIFDLISKQPVFEHDYKYTLTDMNFNKPGDLAVFAFGDITMLDSEMSQYGVVHALKIPAFTPAYDKTFAFQVYQARFDDESRWLHIVAGAERDRDEEVSGLYCVLDAETGSEVLSKAFFRPARSLTFDGAWASISVREAASAFRFDTRWLSPPTEQASPAFIAMLQTRSGLAATATGDFKIASSNQVAERLQNQAKLHQEPPQASAAWQDTLLKWADTPLERRTLSPWSQNPMRHVLGEVLMSLTENNPYSLSRQDVESMTQMGWHPLQPLAIACVMPEADGQGNDNVERFMKIYPQFLARLTLRRLRDADEKLYARELLARYAEWAAEVMANKLALTTEAIEAVTFALERTPVEKQQDLQDKKTALLKGKE